jgi:DNA-binding transcriptional LysR family regulator
MAPARDPELEAVVVQRDRPVLAISERDEFAARNDLRLADLAGKPLVLFPRSYRPSLYDRIKRELDGANLLEDEGSALSSDDSRLGLIATGFGRTIVSARRGHDRYPKVLFKEVVDLTSETLELSLVWRREDTPQHHQFYASLAAHLRQAGGLTG